MSNPKEYWKEALFKGQNVFVQTDEGGNAIAKNGLLSMKYKLDGGKVYSASEKNIELSEGELHESAGKTAQGQRSSTKAQKTVPTPRENAIVIYTDGACSGNPGPAGFGVFVENGSRPAEISGFLGEGTNNIAELEAIGAALEWVQQDSQPVDLYTDSSYAIGVLTKGWKAKANQAVIARIRKQVSAREGLQLHWVKGHAGLPGNEKADELARKAIETSSSDTILLARIEDAQAETMQGEV